MLHVSPSREKYLQKLIRNIDTATPNQQFAILTIILGASFITPTIEILLEFRFLPQQTITTCGLIKIVI